ncbi:MAG: hypothetical protein ACLP50_22565 [Solirubrobacteraceae bacterium]
MASAAVVTVLCLICAASAMAWRLPTDIERAAIAKAAASTPHAGDSTVKVTGIRVSTVGPWASAQITIEIDGSSDSATDILHDVHGQWVYDSVGTAGEWCVMPRTDIQNLGFPVSYACSQGTAGATTHSPVIGCSARGADPSGVFVAYAPAVCDLSSVGPGGVGYASEATLNGFSGVRWSDWGKATATGQGVSVFCSDGCWTSKVTVTAYGLMRIESDPALYAYSRLRFVEPPQVVSVVGRTSEPIRYTEPGYTATYDVLPAA